MSKYDNLSDIWNLKKRGARDSARHKELVRRAIRKNGKDLITEYNIIKSDGNKKVKIPIKFLDKIRLKYGKMKKDQGTGQGVDAEVGKEYRIKREKGPNGEPNKPSNEDGERTFEAEISIDELVDIMLEELELPWMDPKNTSEIEIETDEINSRDRTGIMPNLDIKRTIFENLKRNAARGEAKIGDFHKGDFRYRTYETEREYHSNAAIYLMLDRSGSMGPSKMKIAKTYYFWMVQFLRRRYKKIDLVFIGHDSSAFIVDEDEFFKIASSGGTQCSSAFKLALDHIKTHHPPDKYNNYIFEFSDGDNFGVDNDYCVEYVKQLIPLVKAIGYGEIILEDEGRPHGWLKRKLLSDIFNEEIKRTRFVSMKLTSKEDIFLALKKFFNVDGSAKKDKR